MTVLATTRTLDPAALQASLDRWRERTGAPGVAVAIRKRGALAGAAASGVADADTGRRLLTTHTMAAASITKLLTSATAIRLAERGALDLDAPVVRWTGRRVPHVDGVTLRMLLSHTAGVPGYVTADFRRQLETAPATPWTRAQVLDYIGSLSRPFAPGRGFDYSNSNFQLAAIAIEQAAGAPLAAVVSRELFEPLRVSGAVIDDGRGSFPATATGHRGKQGALTTERRMYGSPSMLRSVLLGDAGLVTSAPALAALGEAILSERGTALTAASRQQMLAGARTSEHANGLGVFRTQLTTPSGRSIDGFGHSGGMPGFTSQLVHDPATDTTLAVLANSDALDGSPMELAGELFDLV